MDFCTESLFRLGMLCIHLSRVALRITKTNHMYLVYKTFLGRNLSNFSVVFWKMDGFIKYILTLSDLQKSHLNKGSNLGAIDLLRVLKISNITVIQECYLSKLTFFDVVSFKFCQVWKRKQKIQNNGAKYIDVFATFCA